MSNLYYLKYTQESEVYIEANSEEEAQEKVSYMGQNEMEEKAEDTWDVDSFPMICTVEEIK